MQMMAMNDMPLSVGRSSSRSSSAGDEDYARSSGSAHASSLLGGVLHSGVGSAVGHADGEDLSPLIGSTGSSGGGSGNLAAASSSALGVGGGGGGSNIFTKITTEYMIPLFGGPAEPRLSVYWDGDDSLGKTHHEPGQKSPKLIPPHTYSSGVGTNNVGILISPAVATVTGTSDQRKESHRRKGTLLVNHK